jgi:DNA-binding MarR family transcriptional regulator
MKLEGDKRIAKYGLTSVQGRILFYIDHRIEEHKEVVHQQDIQKEFHLSKSTVSGIVSRLEHNGFITKINKHPYSCLELTDTAKMFVKQFKERGEELENISLQDVDEKTLEIVGSTIKRMIKNVYKEEE